MFNASKSGKSYIYVDGNKMYVISVTVYNMVKSGQISEVEFAEGGDLKNDDGTLAFNTMKVKDWTESVTAKLSRVTAEIEAIEAFDADRYAAAQEKLKGLVI